MSQTFVNDVGVANPLPRIVIRNTGREIDRPGYPSMLAQTFEAVPDLVAIRQHGRIIAGQPTALTLPIAGWQTTYRPNERQMAAIPARQAPDALCRAIAYIAEDPHCTELLLHYAGFHEPDDYDVVLTHMRSGTLVEIDDIVEIIDVEELEHLDDERLQAAFGVLYVEAPETAHGKLGQRREIERDLALHAAIIRAETGYYLTPAEIDFREVELRRF